MAPWRCFWFNRGYMSPRRSPLARAVMLALALVATYGCGGGLSCGSSSGCQSAYDFPQTNAQVPNGDQFVDEGVRMRMTQNALDFLVENIRPILGSLLGTDPAFPGMLVIHDRNRHDLGAGISINADDNETRPLSLVIDGDALANGLQVEFVGVNPGEPDGIHIVAQNVPVGIEARIFSDFGLGAAACDLFGTNGGLGGRPMFTTLSIDATIKPRVGNNAECDNNAPECLKIDVTVNSASIGGFGAGDLALDKPPKCPGGGCDFAVSCHDGTPDGDGVCSEECSDYNALVDTNGDTECSGVCAIGNVFVDIAAAFAGLVNNLIQGFLPGLLETALRNALDQFDGSPIAASGRLSLAGFAPGILPSSALDMGFAVGPTAGAFDVNAPDPSPGAQGMDMILKSGFEAAPSLTDDTPVPNPCVRHIEGNDFSDLYGGFEFEVPDAQPLTGVFDGQVYSLGASLAAPALNQALFAAYNSGALCIEASPDAVHQLTKGAFELKAGLIDVLTGGKLGAYTSDNSPALIAIAPSQPPVLTYGEGTDTDGHIKITWPNTEVSFYVQMNERFSRVFAVATDISMQLSVFNDPATSSLRIAVVDGPNIENFTERYNELLPGVAFTEVLQSLIGTVFDAAIGNNLEFNFDVGPTLSSALGGAPIFVQFVGLETTPPEDRQFLNVYLGLTSEQPQPFTARTLDLRIADDAGVLRMPDAEQLPPGMTGMPTGQVRVETDDAFDGHEYFARVDFGMWRGPIEPGADGVVVIKDPKLFLVGEHTVTLRARTIGDPNSLEPEDGAQSVKVWVDPEPPKVDLKVVGEDVVAHGFDVGSPFEALRWQWQLDDGDWSDPGTTSVRSVKELAHDGARRVAVRAIDAAGNVSRAAGLDLIVAGKRIDEEAAARGGCAQTGADGLWLGALALASALALRRRRR